MVHRVAGCAIHDRAVGNVLAIVDEDGPKIDKPEQEDVGDFLQGEDEGKDVVRDTLGPAIEWMESVRSVGARHDPFVVGLV